MSTDSLINWLETVWGNTDGYVYLATKDSNEVWRKAFAIWPSQKSQVKDYILRQAAQSNEVYYSPVIWKEKSLAANSFKASKVLWVDFDGNAPSDWSAVKPITPPAVSSASAADSEPLWSIPEPTARVQSSSPGNQHMYWVLEEPITDPVLLQNLNRTLALDLNSDISVWNFSRVLRPPGTVNFGYGKEERRGKHYPVIIEESSDRRYRLENFKETKDFKPLLRSKLSDIPPIQDVLAKRDWHDDFYKLFTSQPGQGDRSGAMMKAAYYAAEAGFTPEEIYAVLIDCDNRWGKYTNRTDREQRLTDIIDRAIEKHPTALAELTFAGLVNGVTTGPAGVEVKSVYDLDEFMSTDIKIDWLFKGMLSVGGHGIIAGQPGIGKTQLALRLGESAATGQKFLDWNYEGKPRKTLFISLEMSFAELQEFFQTMGNSFMEEHRSNFMIAPVGDIVPFDKPEGKKYIESLLDKAQPELIIIDSLANATTGKISDDDAMNPLNQYFTRLRQKYGCATVLVHHNRKSQDKRFISKELDDLYGSRFIAKDAQFVFMLYKTPKDAPNTLTLNPAKTRFAASPGELRLERQSDLSFEYMLLSNEGELSVNFDAGSGRFGIGPGGERPKG